MLVALIAAASFGPFAAPAALPQDPDPLAVGGVHRVRGEEIASAAGAAVAIVWPHPSIGSPRARLALANALAQFRHLRTRGVLPADAETTLEVGDTFAVHGLSVPRRPDAAAIAAQWIVDLARPADLPRERDALALAAARAALAADDAIWLYPGEILLGRLRADRLGLAAADAALLGDPAVLQALGTEQLAAFADAGPGAALCVAVLGERAVVDAVAQAVATIRSRPEPAGPGDVAPAHGLRGDQHPRTAGPYVGVAFAAPAPSADELPFAIAVEVLRARAQRRFSTWRGDEGAARAPFVRHAFLLGDPVLALFRRGPDHSDPERPRRELQALLDEVRSRRVLADEHAAAVRLLAAEWAVPPFAAPLVERWRTSALGMLPRARVLALLGHWRIPDQAVRDLSRIGTEVVSARLATLLGGDPSWSALVPIPRPGPFERAAAATDTGVR